MSIAKHCLVGILIPTIFIINAFLVPEPYSHFLINIAIAPLKIMPFLEDFELMSNLTIMVFGRMTANFFPIQFLFLVAFWFVFSMMISLLFSKCRALSTSSD